MNSAAETRVPLYGLVVAYGISQLGTAMSGLAIPWLVLVTTGSPARTGLVGFAEMAPYVTVQALSGPLVDRAGLRTSCVAGNAVAAILVGVIPGLYALGDLSVGSLAALVAVAGAVRGASDAATMPMVPRTASFGGIPSEKAAGLNSVAQRTGLLAGLPLAGVLVAAAGPATVILVDAVTFAVAAVLVAAAVRPRAAWADPGAPDTPAGSFTVRGYLSQLGEGMRFLRADRLVAGIALMVAAANLLDEALDTIFVPVWVHTRLHHPSGLGLIGGAMAIGSVAGSLASTWLGPRMPRHLTYAVGFLLSGSPVFVALATASSLPPVLLVAALGGLAGGVLNPIIGAVTYERVPPRLQARVLGAFRASAWMGLPFGSLLGGALTEGIGLRSALLATGAAMFLTTLAPFLFPAWRGMNRQPLPRQDADAPEARLRPRRRPWSRPPADVGWRVTLTMGTVAGFAPYQPGSGLDQPGSGLDQPGSGLEPLHVRLRRATERDVKPLNAIQLRAGRPARAETLRRSILDKDRLVVVAELDGEEGSAVAGWAQTYHHTAHADPAPTGHYLGGVTVDPEWRRRGVATALTDARIAWVAGRADEVFYVVNIGNRASIDLHIRWGFREVGRGPQFAGIEFSGGVGLLMRADLSAHARSRAEGVAYR